MFQYLAYSRCFEPFTSTYAQESKIASEREAGKSHQESAMQRTHELEAMKSLLSANHP